MSHAPPYALTPPRFRFCALAALAGRSPLGGEREVALATLLTARLVAGALPPQPLPQAVRASRAGGARTWLATLALPTAVRPALAQLVEVTAAPDLGALAPALDHVIAVCSPQLDAAALAELRELVRALEPTP